eukprot:6200114-Pleurochrysis_carterae.AAC.2
MQTGQNCHPWGKQEQQTASSVGQEHVPAGRTDRLLLWPCWPTRKARRHGDGALTWAFVQDLVAQLRGSCVPVCHRFPLTPCRTPRLVQQVRADHVPSITEEAHEHPPRSAQPLAFVRGALVIPETSWVRPQRGTEPVHV